jgi:hypothetical protein
MLAPPQNEPCRVPPEVFSAALRGGFYNARYAVLLSYDKGIKKDSLKLFRRGVPKEKESFCNV